MNFKFKTQLLRTQRIFCQSVPNQVKGNLTLFHLSYMIKPLFCFCQKLWTRKGDTVFWHLYVEYTPHWHLKGLKKSFFYNMLALV